MTCCSDSPGWLGQSMFFTVVSHTPRSSRGAVVGWPPQASTSPTATEFWLCVSAWRCWTRNVAAISSSTIEPATTESIRVRRSMAHSLPRATRFRTARQRRRAS